MYLDSGSLGGYVRHHDVILENILLTAAHRGRALNADLLANSVHSRTDRWITRPDFCTKKKKNKQTKRNVKQRKCRLLSTSAIYNYRP